MDSTIKNQVENSSRTAEDFTRLYYASFDTRRHTIGRLYLDNAVFSWNGNGATGNDSIQRYILELPASVHQLSTLDAQPILDSAVSDQLTYTILASGSVKYGTETLRFFQQSFIVTAKDDKWKIFSDCYRLQDVAF